MKTLFLIRHAKSDWSKAGEADFDRGLNERGKANAPEMAERLLSRGEIPDLIVSSPAKRAKKTAEKFHKKLNLDPEIQFEEEIYEASAKTLLRIINQFRDDFSRIALVGHNPGLTYLAEELANAGIYNIPTCGIVCIRFPFERWSMVSAGTGELVFFDYPKNLSDD